MLVLDNRRYPFHGGYNQTMRRIILGVVFVIVAGYVPLYWYDSKKPKISESDRQCLHFVTTSMMDNPLERLVTRLALVTNNTGDQIIIIGYSFFGIPVSKFSANCKDGSMQRL